jgi:mRNA-degrading endonuclease RelE of RelBE toxin-antitoxin system
MVIGVLPGALEDIRALKASDPAALAAVMTFLQEAEADPDLLTKFTGFGKVKINQTTADVKRWVAARGIGDFFRIRILDTPATSYRVIYGWDWRSKKIGLLAVKHKDEFSYEITGELADRIRDDWRRATDSLFA